MANSKQIEDFLKTISPLAVKEYNRRINNGLAWVLPSVCIAQAALETGWGNGSQLMIKANAYFGIKWTKNCGYKAYSSKTKEVYDGKTTTVITAAFRAYDSLEDSIKDYYKLICDSGIYKNCQNIADPSEAIERIAPIYATDPNYAKSIKEIIKFKNLTQYDKRTESSPTKEVLEVDGVWGVETTKKAQEVFKTTVDGYVSKQLKMYRETNPGLSDSAWQWTGKSSDNGSALIRAIQAKVGVKADGHIGPITIKAMQKWLGTTPDGFVSRPSSMVKAFQTWLNKQ